MHGKLPCTAMTRFDTHRKRWKRSKMDFDMLPTLFDPLKMDFELLWKLRLHSKIRFDRHPKLHCTIKTDFELHRKLRKGLKIRFDAF
jgi:hypothetical protein